MAFSAELSQEVTPRPPDRHCAEVRPPEIPYELVPPVSPQVVLSPAADSFCTPSSRTSLDFSPNQSNKVHLPKCLPRSLDPSVRGSFRSTGTAPARSKTLTEELPHHLQTALQLTYSSQGDDKPDPGIHEHVDGHSHSEGKTSIVTAVASAGINYMLMFGLCCAYGMIMFADEFHGRHRALGVKMNLLTAMVVGMLLAVFSGIPVAIGGPDLNPVVFVGGFVTTIASSIADQLELAYPDEGSSDTNWCSDESIECEDYHAQLRATSIFSVAVSSAIFSVIFFCFGHFKLTRMVNYLPASIMEAFLSCIGYKVFKYALKFSKYEVQQFGPAAFVGVLLYFMKAKHVGNPALVMPLGLLAPLAIFYIVVYFANPDDPIGQARDKGYMFPEMLDEGNEFWRIWSDSIGQASKINFKAWLKTAPDLIIMIVVVVMDCVLKISGTESKLPVKVLRDYEMQLFGLGNVFTSLCGSSVGYMQLKFNVINYGVMRNCVDRRGGAIYAFLCGVCFFWRIKPFNYLPRFFLSTLLFFAGAGFVAENLWGSRKYLSFKEWLEVLTIILVFIFTDQLLYAVIAGGFLTSITFVLRYARIPAIAGAPATGMTIMTSDRRGLEVQRSLQHIAGSWLLVLRLKGYMFFASASSVVQYVRNRWETEEELEVPHFRRLHFVIFDCELLDHMDVSAAKSMKKFIEDAMSRKVRVLWSHVSVNFHEELQMREIKSTGRDCFQNLDDALRHVENAILQYRLQVQERWISLHPTFVKSRELRRAQVGFEPFEHIFMVDRLCVGCPWLYCTKRKIERFKTMLLRGGEVKDMLYLVHSGKVGMFDCIQGRDGKTVWSSPKAIYGHGWFVNREAMTHAPSSHYAIALEDGEVLCWTMDQWRTMSRESPNMASEMMKGLLRQQMRDAQETARTAGNLSHDMDETQWVDFQEEVEPVQLTHTMRSMTLSAEMRVSQSVINFITKGAGAPSISRGVTSAHLSVVSNQQHAPKKRRSMQVPEVIRIHLQQFQAAKALGKIGLFSKPSADPGEGGVRPGLPMALRRHLEIGFTTFCEKQTNEDGELVDVVPQSALADALKYAGVFHMQAPTQQSPLDKEAFLDLGHNLLMAELTEEQLQVIEGIFTDYDTDCSGYLEVAELAVALKGTLDPNISSDEVEIIAKAWGMETGAGHVDLKVFTAIMSHYIRKHEHNWDLLQGLRDIMGENTEVTRRLTVNKLTHNKNVKLTEEEAEEMLWCADWRIGDESKEGQELDFGGVLHAVHLFLEEPVGKLPPPPRCPATQREMRRNRTYASSGAASASIDSDDCDLGMYLQDQASKSRSEMMLFKFDSRLSASHWTGSAEMGRLTSSGDLSKVWGPEEKAAVDMDGWRARLHLVLENPSSGPVANALSIILGVLIILSVLMLILEPTTSGKEEHQADGVRRFWFTVELFFSVTFTIEYVLRFLVSDALGNQTKWAFFRSPTNICDLVAVTPLYIDVLLQDQLKAFRLLLVVRLSRLSRLARLGRLARLSRLSKKTSLAAPVSMVLVVIWGIYLKDLEGI